MTPDDENHEEGFEIFRWKGQKRYRCNRTWESGTPCAFDTYNLRDMFDHVRSPHNLTGKDEKPAKKRVSPLVDERGQNIVVEDAPEQFRAFHFKGE